MTPTPTGARGRVWWRPIPADSVDTQKFEDFNA
jgi:hypothetical protein